ncbi:unnamed protein product [Leuciscus chuanchicus]
MKCGGGDEDPRSAMSYAREFLSYSESHPGTHEYSPPTQRPMINNNRSITGAISVCSMWRSRWTGSCQQLDDPRAALKSTVIFPVDERMDTGQSVGARSRSSEEKTCTRKQQEEASNPSRGTPKDPRERGKKKPEKP